MKRKVYTSGYERKRDQRIGAVAFPLVNGALWLLVSWAQGPGKAFVQSALAMQDSFLRNAILLLPWIVNGALLVLAFIFRPQIAVGYLTCFAALLAAGVTLGGLVVASCVLALILFFVPPLAYIVFFGVLGVGFFWLLGIGLGKVLEWWSKYEDIP